MATMIDLETAGGTAFRAWETGPSAAPGVVLVHEWWGLNEVTKASAEELGKLGYRALAVDLYAGRVTADRAEAAKLMGGLDKKLALAKIDAAVRHLAAGGRRVGTIGWCMGGGLSLRAALSQPDLVAAAVIFYGETVEDPALLATLRGPVLGVFAERDGWITRAMADRFESALTTAKVPHDVRVFPADHAFFNPRNANHDKACAAEAWAMVTAFFEKNLR